MQRTPKLSGSILRGRGHARWFDRLDAPATLSALRASVASADEAARFARALRIRIDQLGLAARR